MNYISPKEIAQELEVSLHFVYDLLITGELKGRKLRGRWFIRREMWELFKQMQGLTM